MKKKRLIPVVTGVALLAACVMPWANKAYAMNDFPDIPVYAAASSTLGRSSNYPSYMAFPATGGEGDATPITFEKLSVGASGAYALDYDTSKTLPSAGATIDPVTNVNASLALAIDAVMTKSAPSGLSADQAGYARALAIRQLCKKFPSNGAVPAVVANPGYDGDASDANAVVQFYDSLMEAAVSPVTKTRKVVIATPTDNALTLVEVNGSCTGNATFELRNFDHLMYSATDPSGNPITLPEGAATLNGQILKIAVPATFTAKNFKMKLSGSVDTAIQVYSAGESNQRIVSAGSMRVEAATDECILNVALPSGTTPTPTPTTTQTPTPTTPPTTTPVGITDAKIITKNSANTGIPGARYELRIGNDLATSQIVRFTKLADGSYEYNNATGTVTELSGFEDGSLILKRLPVGMYYIAQVSAPTGYEKLTTSIVKQEIKASTSAVEITFTNYKAGEGFEVKATIFLKYDTTKGVNGAKFDLRDKNGNVVATGTSNTSGVVSLKAPAGEYTLRQVEAVDNMAVSALAYNVTIAAEGTITVGENKKLEFAAEKPYIKLLVKNAKNSLIQNAEFGLYDSSDKQIATAKSNEDGYAIFGELAYGTYTVKQLTVPTGYTRAKNIKFEINSRFVNTITDAVNSVADATATATKNPSAIQTGVDGVSTSTILLTIVGFIAMVTGAGALVFATRKKNRDR